MKYRTAIMMAVGVFLVIGYFAYTKPDVLPTFPPPDALAFPELVFTSDVSPATGPETSSAGAPARTLPAGMKEYRSSAYHFSLFYPRELSVTEYAEGSGATTVTFQNVEKAQGFQIFIVPYRESQVSAKRFRQDVPSGVRKSLTSVTVDGSAGAAFLSENAALGATKEVWFTHGGFLYEITTLAPLDAWLAPVIQTWKFI